METVPLVLSEPCTKMWEHYPHPFMLIPFHNLGYPKTVSCPGWKKPE